MFIVEENLYGATKEDFNNLFNEPDPWQLNRKVEQLRYRISIDYIKKINKNKSTEILELGCAEGNFTEYLSREKYRIKSIDISENAIKRAIKKNLANTGFVCSEMIDYVKNNSLKKFDNILLLESLCYLKNEEKNILLKLIADKTGDDIKVFFSLPVMKNNEMFLTKDKYIELFSKNGFLLSKKVNPAVITLKGKSGILSAFIPFYFLQKLFIKMHKLFLPFRINQMIFMFEKSK
jgi:SAM-dependent methyltransferase